MINHGTWNHDQGPDFQDAKLVIDGQTWVGSVEMHLRTSDWFRHAHEHDPKYRNVILHVVWIHDETPSLPFPTLELHDRISKLMLDKYAGLMSSTDKLPCHAILQLPGELKLLAWKERLVAERLEERSGKVLEMLKATGGHWEEVFWRMIARSFGNGVNSDAFEQIASCIPLKILAKHRSQLIQVEALLLGQAGIIDKEFNDKYPVLLRREYEFLRKKYRLSKNHFPLNYLRMRPANFPAIRLAQLAALICKSHSIFSMIREADDVKMVKQLFEVQANDYWSYHYRPDEESGYLVKKTGEQLVNNIITNTVSVMLHAYGRMHDDAGLTQKAIRWLLEIPAERNRITAVFRETPFTNDSAFDSQGLLQLKQQYCDRKRCLECAVGSHILRDHQL